MPYREVSRAWDFTEYESTELGIPASKHGDIGVICGDAARLLFGFLGWISCQLHRVWTAGCQGLCSYKCRCNCRVRQKLYEIVTSCNYRRGCWTLVCPSGMSAADFSWKNSRFQGLSRGSVSVSKWRQPLHLNFQGIKGFSANTRWDGCSSCPFCAVPTDHDGLVIP